MSRGNREIEIKLALKDAASGRALLRSAGFRISRRRVFEDNLVFDTAAGDLRESGRLLRIREAGGAATLTYKGAGDPGRHKSREEIEAGVEDARAAAAILEGLGYRRMFRYQKYRTEFRRDGAGVAMLDETPVGTYLELEGSARWIDSTARRLGFSESDYILESYGRLYLQWCVQLSVKPGDMVFSAGRRGRARR